MRSIPAVILTLALAAGGAAGQETAPGPGDAADRWRLALDLAFTATSGNSRVSILTSGVQLTHLETDRYEMEVSGKVRYGRSEGEETERSAQAGLKVDLQPRADWSPFVFLTVEHEPFRRLEVRGYSGGGLKRTLWRSDAGKLSVSGAAVYSMEQLQAVDQAPADPVRREVRSSWRIKGARIFSESARVENTTFYQPMWDRPDDYLIEAQTSVTVQLTRRLGLRLSHLYERDSTPPTGVRRNDQVTTIGFAVEL